MLALGPVRSVKKIVLCPLALAVRVSSWSTCMRYTILRVPVGSWSRKSVSVLIAAVRASERPTVYNARGDTPMTGNGGMEDGERYSGRLVRRADGGSGARDTCGGDRRTNHRVPRQVIQPPSDARIGLIPAQALRF